VRQKKFWFVMSGILAVLTMALMLPTEAVAASKYKVLHKFKGKDGARPEAGLIFDAAGSLYGTTTMGGMTPTTCGAVGCGTVFKLTPNKDGSWTEKVLYYFCSLTGCRDGIFPGNASLIFDTAGNLYGTTNGGGGVVFKLTPNSDGSWTESVLHAFTDSLDGSEPSGLIFDTAGNLYGTTENGGVGAAGTVFKLTPNKDGSWTEIVLYSFTGGDDGLDPSGGVIMDTMGNLFGTTTSGGTQGRGNVFQLTPGSDGSWTESTLYSFTGGAHHDGDHPSAGLTFDTAGNIYGTTESGGSKGFGTAFQLTKNSNGGWEESVLHNFEDDPAACPQATMIFDAMGSLYGTTVSGCNFDHGHGAVFELTPQSGGGWEYRIVHAFENKPAAHAFDRLVLDSAGNLYGTTRDCGSGYKCKGVAFEITP
jgi:uncharacterized repeat protein (TIGR03803 family)